METSSAKQFGESLAITRLHGVRDRGGGLRQALHR